LSCSRCYNNNNNNNNLRLIRLRQTTQPYTEQSATQGRNNTMTQLSCRTATTRFSPKAARNRWRQGVANIGSGGPFTLQALTRWHHLAHIRKTGLLLIYRPRRDERLSWPSWLTSSGRFTHIVVTRWLQAEHSTGSVRRPKTGVLPTVLRNQPQLSCNMIGCGCVCQGHSGVSQSIFGSVPRVCWCRWILRSRSS